VQINLKENLKTTTSDKLSSFFSKNFKRIIVLLNMCFIIIYLINYETTKRDKSLIKQNKQIDNYIEENKDKLEKYNKYENNLIYYRDNNDLSFLIIDKEIRSKIVNITKADINEYLVTYKNIEEKLLQEIENNNTESIAKSTIIKKDNKDYIIRYQIK